MSLPRLYSPLAPLFVAAIAIIYIAARQPLSTEFAGLSMNIVAIIIVAIGGLAGATNA